MAKPTAKDKYKGAKESVPTIILKDKDGNIQKINLKTGEDS